MTNKIVHSLSAIFLIALCIIPDLLFAQTDGSGKPYAGEQAVIAKLFNLNEQDINYHFTAELPGGNFLIIEWNHLSDWNNKADLQHIINLARTYEGQVQDSFKSGTTAKRLDIHIPIKNEPITMKVTEHNIANNVLLLKDNMQTSVKVNMDTIRVIKTIGEKKVHKDQKLVQMQYTFLLKDIDGIKGLDNDKEVIADISDKFDSVVNKYKNKWHNEDNWTRNLSVDYFPVNDYTEKRLVIKMLNYDYEKGRYYSHLGFDFGLGVLSFRNNLCPMLEDGASYIWPSHNSRYSFLRLSNTFFIDYLWPSSTDFKAYHLFFSNLEYGWTKRVQTTHIPVYGGFLRFGVCT